MHVVVGVFVAYSLLFRDQETLGHGHTCEPLTCRLSSYGRCFWEPDCISDGTFHLLGDVSSRLVCNAASFSGETRPDLGFHAHAYPFHNSAFSLVESRYSATRWPCDCFLNWRRRRRVLMEKEGSSRVWFRRPATNGSLRSANVTAQNCIFS